MSTEKQHDDGGPALPQIQTCGQISETIGGMTLLDWFAGKALVTILQTESHVLAISKISMEGDKDASIVIAEVAYDIADAMLAERKRRAAL